MTPNQQQLPPPPAAAVKQARTRNAIEIRNPDSKKVCDINELAQTKSATTSESEDSRQIKPEADFRAAFADKVKECTAKSGSVAAVISQPPPTQAYQPRHNTSVPPPSVGENASQQDAMPSLISGPPPMHQQTVVTPQPALLPQPTPENVQVPPPHVQAQQNHIAQQTRVLQSPPQHPNVPQVGCSKSFILFEPVF